MNLLRFHSPKFKHDDNTAGISFSKGTTDYEISGLTTGKEYTITAKTADVK